MKHSTQKTTRIITAACISIGAGISVAVLLLIFVPKEVFGSCFEGSCGYLAMLFSIACALTVGGTSLAILLRKALRSDADLESPIPKPSKARFYVWTCILMLIYLAKIFFGITGDLLIYAALLPAFIVISAQFFASMNKSPLLSLLALVPIAGPAIVGYKLAKPLWFSTRGT